VPAGALGPADGGRGRDSSANKISIAGPARNWRVSGVGLRATGDKTRLGSEGRFIVERHTHQL
jgi:hypothetical protein